jgi:hypothetical protein
MPEFASLIQLLLNFVSNTEGSASVGRMGIDRDDRVVVLDGGDVGFCGGWPSHFNEGSGPFGGSTFGVVTTFGDTAFAIELFGRDFSGVRTGLVF